MIDHAKRTSFQLSQDRQVLEARLIKCFRDCAEDTQYTLPYEELNALVGGDVSRDTNLSSKLSAAMKAVSRELGVTLARGHGRDGIYIVPPDQYTGYIDNRVTKVRRASKRCAAEASRIAKHDGLTPEQRQQIMARGAVAGAIAAFAGKKAITRVETEVRQQAGPLSLNHTIEAFRRKQA